MNKDLSILIASVEERRDSLIELLTNFGNQIHEGKFYSNVEVLREVDNKEISIGLKRQKLLERASGKFVVFFDDDDEPYSFYIKKIIKAIESNKDIDCIGINIDMTTNGTNYQKCSHCLKHGVWRNGNKGEDFDYYRNITHFNPVLREKAIQAGFRDIRFGEDKDYCDRLNPLLNKEYIIEEPIFHYKFTNHQEHNSKYGIK
jgi:hypothetical protein